MKKILATALVFSVLGGASHAATLSYTGSIPLTTTNWANSVSVQKFDPSLGTLNSVTVALKSGVSGDAKGESLDLGPATITLKLQAEVEASTASLGTIVAVLPVVDQVFNASAFDGTIDFAGTSGVSFIGLSAMDSKSSVLTGASMADFIGLGSIGIDVAAVGTSVGTGAGNLITQFATQASADVTVTYDYAEAPAPVPLPASGLLLAGGLLMLRRFRRNAA